MFDDTVDIEKIIHDNELKPYFLEVVGKVLLKNLYASQNHRFVPKLKAQKEFYDSLYSLTEKLKYQVGDDQISSTIAYVLNHYLESLKPVLKKEKFDIL